MDVDFKKAMQEIEENYEPSFNITLGLVKHPNTIERIQMGEAKNKYMFEIWAAGENIILRPTFAFVQGREAKNFSKEEIEELYKTAEKIYIEREGKKRELQNPRG